jgi:hypothetical protein
MQTLATDSLSSLTNPQPYQRERDKPPRHLKQSVAFFPKSGASSGVGFIDFHEKAFKLKMKFISLLY